MGFKNSIAKNMKGGSQLIFLGLYTIAGLFLANFIIFIVYAILTPADIYASGSASFLKISQTIAAICLFLVPSLIFANQFHDSPSQFLGMRYSPPIKHILWVLLIVLVAQPFIDLTSYLNQQMTFPDVLLPLEEWMKSKEAEAERLIELFISDKSLVSIVSNFFVIAVLAGIAEEVFFRGCLQNIFEKITKRPSYAIWITAFIFSAIHLQFYGFIPRLLMGALLGYLYIWTRNLWVPILAHVAHNGLTLLVAQYFYGTEYYEAFKDIPLSYHLLWGGISAIILIVIYVVMKKNRNFVE